MRENNGGEEGFAKTCWNMFLAFGLAARAKWLCHFVNRNAHSLFPPATIKKAPARGLF
jgi:hypothetical protein